MKKSRITKLALSGAAVAALAATFSTSTYAWYVSSQKATVATTNSTTGSADTDGSILLSWNGTNWSKTLDFTTSTGHPTISNASLVPLHDDTDGYYPMTAAGAKGSTAGTAMTDYIQFTLYIKSDTTDALQVSINMDFKNTTTYSDALLQPAYVGTDLGSPVAAGSNFVVDALDSMYVKQTIGSESTVIPCSQFSSQALANKTTAGNAHTYYKNVTSNTTAAGLENLYGATYSSNTTSFTNISVTSTATAITYTIWLEGGDVNCFNSAADQSFSFQINYQVTE